MTHESNSIILKGIFLTYYTILPAVTLHISIIAESFTNLQFISRGLYLVNFSIGGVCTTRYDHESNFWATLTNSIPQLIRGPNWYSINLGYNISNLYKILFGSETILRYSYYEQLIRVDGFIICHSYTLPYTT